MFVPTTPQELKELGIKQLDVIFITGDVYIDVSNDGTALLSKYLMSKGYTVGIISQPSIESDVDISRLGEPRLYWGISAGVVDSMVANYTSLNKPRRDDDLTPGGINNKRPDRAVVQYTNLIKRYYKSRKPIVIGGIEASLRRIAHYDYWTDTIKRSVLSDSKADALIYGMAEKALLEYTQAIENGEDFRDIRGLCYMSNEPKEGFIELPEYQEAKTDKDAFTRMFNTFYKNFDPVSAKGMYQKTDSRYLIHNPPQMHLTQKEIDEIYSLKFEHDAHPYYKAMGKIPALETVRFSITTHRGCFGECSFCAIAVHQGRRIISRSKENIIEEVCTFTKNKHFKGNISDIGGATANMYDMSCEKQCKLGACTNKSCVSPNACKGMNISHKPVIELLRDVRKVPGVKRIFIGSGIRYDMILADKQHGDEYLRDVLAHHISGQMKIAPEHINANVLRLMNKPDNTKLSDFIAKFKQINKELDKKQFLTYYFIAAAPGSSDKENNELKAFIDKEIQFAPEQIQIFTPTPCTYSTLQYYTGKSHCAGKSDLDGTDVFVEKKNSLKAKQKEILQAKHVKPDYSQKDSKHTTSKNKPNKHNHNKNNNSKDNRNENRHRRRKF